MRELELEHLSYERHWKEPVSVRWVEIQGEIVQLALSMDDLEGAERALVAKLRLQKELHADDAKQEAVATTYQQLGDVRAALGLYRQAMDDFFTALDMWQDLYGNGHVAVAETFYSMGHTLIFDDSFSQALDCLDESLAIMKILLGPDASEVGDILNEMGVVQTKQDEPDEALSLLVESLRIRKLHEEYEWVTETQRNIATIHYGRGEIDLVTQVYDECLSIGRQFLGVEHRSVADTLIAIGDFQKLGPQEAVDYYQEALDIRRTQLQDDHELIADALVALGDIYLRMDQESQAMVYYQEGESELKYCFDHGWQRH